jgi:hypothetical protein
MIMRSHKQIRLMLTNLTCQDEPSVSHQFKLNHIVEVFTCENQQTYMLQQHHVILNRHKL